MLYALLAIAVALTFVMFLSRNMMLGFPCAMFWAIMGGYCYTQSTATWDIWYFLFFASAFGMTIFTALAAFALRESKDIEADKDEYIDEGKDDIRYIDEGKSTEEGEGEEPGMSKRTKGIRARAKKRRSGESRNRRL